MLDRRSVLLGGSGFAFLPGEAFAQPAMSATARLLLEGRYLPRWLELQGDSSDLGRAIRPQFAAFVGEEARAFADRRREAPFELAPDARAGDAVRRIVQAASGRRLVMLNEAHDASRHRLFLAQVLRALRAEGFTHLAAEAFGMGPNDPKIEDYRAGRPFAPGYGWYTRDPVFAEAVREAAELGYRFIRYEQRPDQNDPKDADSKARIARREAAQADNFTAALQADPQARVLVYVGYSHLREGPDAQGNVWFASRLKEKTGIDPLTVEQSTTGSFGPHGQDSGRAQAVLAHFQPNAPVVVDTAAGVLGAAAFTADLAVFHPSLPEVSGRPGWLAADPKRRRTPVRLPTQGFRGLALAQALHASDPEPAVPADQYLLPYGAREAVFLLRPGRYRVRLEMADGFQPVGELTV